MKIVSLPKHDDQIHAILIDGAYYEGNVVYVPCQLSNGRQIRVPVISPEGYGIHVRRIPVLLLGASTGPELAVATLHVRRMHITKNINAVTPHFFLDERTVIDLTTEKEVQPTNRRGRVAYEYMQQPVRGRYAVGQSQREIYISDQQISHPELDDLAQVELDDAVQRMNSADTSWYQLCQDHKKGRMTIDLPGIDMYLRHELETGIYLPTFYATHLKQNAGGSSITLPRDRDRSKQRHELVEFIEMLSGMSSILVNDVKIAYDGSIPEVEFSRDGLHLSLMVNELPLFGNFAVADKTQHDFEKKFVIYENLAQAVTAITARMNYA